MYITIVIDTMMHGGAHRVACLQANMLVEAGHNVTIVFLNNPCEFPYPISEKVKLVGLLNGGNLEYSSIINKVKRHLSYLPCLCWYFYKNRNIDICISHIQGVNLNSILAAKLFNVPIIVSEHTTHLLPRGVKGFFANIERKYIYRMASAVTVLTNYEQDFYRASLTNVYHLPNPIPFPILSYSELDEKNKNNDGQDIFILVAGDLNRVHIKGWDTLLHVFSKVIVRHPEVRLKFAGDSNKNSGLLFLKNLSRELGVSDKVEFLGSVNDMQSLYRSATVFLLTSRYEGFSMVIAEALSQGCPVVSFNCPSGPAELIDDGHNGFLVENQNIDSMVDRLSVLLSNNELRRNMSFNAIGSVEPYSVDVIYEKLLKIIEVAK